MWIYSTEALPNTALIGKPMYTPEYIQWNGIQLIVPAKEWIELPDNYYTLHHRDWRDRVGQREHIPSADIAAYVRKHYSDRGVIVQMNKPEPGEMHKLEKQSEEANIAFRYKAIEEYEHQLRDREVTGTGRTKPTPYEDECYNLTGVTKPYSVEAMRAQRMPGVAVGEEIVAALERLNKRRLNGADSTPSTSPVRPATVSPDSDDDELLRAINGQ